MGRFPRLSTEMLAARYHVRAALGEEMSREVLQTTVHAGVPAANRAFAVAQQVLTADESWA
jgi:alkylhydroperoxidase/carboxymuconolactone decarboxylase family protein YurZ